MNSNTLSQVHARLLALHCQGLIGTEIPATPHGTLATLERIGYVQIDTISVVERAHHHVFWNRQAAYKPAYLDTLIDEKSAFEYWSHAAAFLPMRDYRYSLLTKKNFQARYAARAEDNRMLTFVLDRITAEGALQARDFENTNAAKGGWWEHKPAKSALERLFIEGKLMIAKRINFQKVFDLPERVVPKHVNTAMPTHDEYTQHLIRTTIKAHGLATAEEIGYLRGGSWKPLVAKNINHLIEQGEIQPVTIESHKQTYYTTPALLQAELPAHNHRIHLLSPFDNTVIQRKRLKQLWQYEYQIECYVPAPKRVFGYFCLPVLEGINFIGRIDAKADRRTKRLILQSLHIEKPWSGNTVTLKQAIETFATFNGCTAVDYNGIVW